MTEERIRWPDLPWQAGGHPLEQKKVAPGPCTLLRFAPGFADPNLCLRSHILHVLEGTLTLELEGRVEHYPQGESILLAPNTAHRARNDSLEDVVLLIVSDVRWT